MKLNKLRLSAEAGLAIVLSVLGGACGSDRGSASWGVTPPPTVTDQTDDVIVAKGLLANGTYWAEAALVSGSNDLVFRVTKVRFGAICERWAKENGLEFCANDYAVEPFPDAVVALLADATVTVAQPDGPGTNYSITPEELRKLIRGESVDGPDGYSWAGFPFVVEVRDGSAVSAAQFWVP